MVIPENRDGKLADDVELQRGVKSANQTTISSRKGGFQAAPLLQPKVSLTATNHRVWRCLLLRVSTRM